MSQSSPNFVPELLAAVLPAVWLRRAKLLGSVASQNIRHSQITRMAAALSFRTLFALLPILVIGLVVVHRFVPEDMMRDTVSRLLNFTGLTQIEVAKPKPSAEMIPGLDIFSGSMLLADPAAIARAKEQLQQSKEQNQRLDEWITDLLTRVDKINFAAIGWVGLLMLIYAALSMVIEIEKAFNQIARAPTGKSWLRRVTHYWALLTLGPLLLILSFAVSESATRLAARWSQPAPMAQSAAPVIAQDAGADAPALVPAEATAKPKAAAAQARSGLVRVVGFLCTVLLSTITLAIVYTSIPNTRIAIPAALAGAAFAALLWEASKWAFTAYAKVSTGYSLLYGALALIPLFMLWVYVTWVIVLIGFQTVVTLQTFRRISKRNFQESLLIALGLAEDPNAGPGGVRLLAPSAALRCVCAVAERFRFGRPAPLELVAHEAGLDDTTAREVLERLADAGLLHRLAAPAGSEVTVEQYALARAPEGVLAADVLALLEGGAGVGGEAGGGAAQALRGSAAVISRAVQDAQAKALGLTSLADLLVVLDRARAAEAGGGDAPSKPVLPA